MALGIPGKCWYFGMIHMGFWRQFHFLTVRISGFLLLDVVIGLVVMGLLVHALTMAVQSIMHQSGQLNQNYHQTIKGINQVMSEFESGAHTFDDFRLCVHDISGEPFYFLCLK